MPAFVGVAVGVVEPAVGVDVPVGVLVDVVVGDPVDVRVGVLVGVLVTVPVAVRVGVFVLVPTAGVNVRVAVDVGAPLELHAPAGASNAEIESVQLSSAQIAVLPGNVTSSHSRSTMR